MVLAKDRTHDCLTIVRATQLTKASNLGIKEYFETKTDGGSAKTMHMLVVVNGTGAVLQKLISLKVG